MLELKDIKPGTVISGPRWREPVEVKKIDNDGSYVHIVGATTITAQHIDQLIPINELSDVSIKVIETDFKSEPLRHRLGSSERAHSPDSKSLGPRHDPSRL